MSSELRLKMNLEALKESSNGNFSSPVKSTESSSLYTDSSCEISDNRSGSLPNAKGILLVLHKHVDVVILFVAKLINIEQ